MTKNIFIIGNGFDLDLGMKTKYSDFANNEKYWPKDNGNEICGLEAYLEKKKDLEKWFDLENELKNYSIFSDIPPMHIKSMNSDNDKKYFEKIRENLREYFALQELGDLNLESVAAKVLKAILDNGYFTSCYSFNYTDLNKIVNKLHVGKQINYTHIHGSIKQKSIILGVGSVKLRKGYDFLEKTASEFYQPNSILSDLDKSEEIVFFGMSFGEIDNIYFKNFFKKITSIDYVPNKKIFITIFTYNEDSRTEIIKNLSDLVTEKTVLFQNNITFIRTQNNMDSQKLDDFCKRLQKKSYSANEHRLSGILNKLAGI